MINTIKSYSSDNSELRRGRVVSGKPMDHTIRSNVGRHSLCIGQIDRILTKE